MVDIYWRIGTHGDQSSLRRKEATRGDWGRATPGSIAPGRRGGAADGYSYLDHMADVAKAAEVSGFVGGLLPSFPFTDDPWVAAAALANETRSFRFMVAFQPGFLDPFHAARTSATLQRTTGGRVVYNIITGGGGPEQTWWGDPVAHDDRYRRTGEFLEILRGVWGRQPFTFPGQFYDVRDAHLPADLADQPIPEIYFSGSSPAAIQTASGHADYYLSWLEPFAALREKFEQVRSHSAALGRRPRFALRVEILARASESEAWEELERGWRHVDQTSLNRQEAGDSIGAMRSRAFVRGTVRTPRDMEVEPQVWGGFHLLRGGPAFGLVGSYDQVAARLEELVELGTDAFILAGVPHLEEAYRIGAEVLPRLTFAKSGYVGHPAHPSAATPTPLERNVS